MGEADRVAAHRGGPGVPRGVRDADHLAGEDLRLTVTCRGAVWATWARCSPPTSPDGEVLAERRGRYVLYHWLDVLIIALPLLRPLRLLRLITLLKVLNRRASTGLRGRVAIYVAGGRRCSRSAVPSPS